MSSPTASDSVSLNSYVARDHALSVLDLLLLSKLECGGRVDREAVEVAQSNTAKKGGRCPWGNWGVTGW